MNTHEISIIEMGYQTLLRKYHPDRFPSKDRVIQDEVCKQLAVARDRLQAMLSQQAAPSRCTPPTPVPQGPAPQPIINEEAAQLLIDFVGEALGIKTRRARKSARRPRA